jgi:hypothetical protein
MLIDATDNDARQLVSNKGPIPLCKGCASEIKRGTKRVVVKARMPRRNLVYTSITSIHSNIDCVQKALSSSDMEKYNKLIRDGKDKLCPTPPP